MSEFIEGRTNPLGLVNGYFLQMRARGILAPLCLSTLADGHPTGRFVDLKGVTDSALQFGTDERSHKADEFRALPRVSATMWWEPLGVQIRVKGLIQKGDEVVSDRVFGARNLTAKAVAAVSAPSQPLVDPEELKRMVVEFAAASRGSIPRPGSWWIYEIFPSEIEILQFTDDRIHRRTLYKASGGGWTAAMLNP